MEDTPSSIEKAVPAETAFETFKKSGQIPATIQDITALEFLAEARKKGLEVIVGKLKGKPDAPEQYKAALKDGQQAAECFLWCKAEIGGIAHQTAQEQRGGKRPTKKTGKAVIAGGRGTSDPSRELGLSKNALKEAETLDLHRDEIKQVIEAARLADDIPSQAEVFRVITLADAARVKAANGVDEQEKRQEKSTPKPYLNRNEARAGDEQKLTKEEKSLADKIQPPDELMRFERYQTALKKVNASLATILKVTGRFWTSTKPRSSRKRTRGLWRPPRTPS